MTSTLYPLTLDGDAVRLEALSLDHVDGLVAAAAESRATYGLTQVPADREGMVRYVNVGFDPKVDRILEAQIESLLN